MLRFSPVTVKPSEQGVVPVDLNDDTPISALDILKTMLPENDRLYTVTSQLLNPQVEAGALLDQYVDTRLAAVT